MRAQSLFLVLLLWMQSGMIEPWSVASPQQNIVSLKQKFLIAMEDEREIKLENCTGTNNVSGMCEALRNELQTLLSNRTSCVVQLEDEVKQKLQNQTALLEKISKQLEDFQSLMTCVGEPPSPQNGKPVEFERKQGSEVMYDCEADFVPTGNSTVRCHFGKWEGEPPVCTRKASLETPLTLRAHLDDNYMVVNFTCSGGDSNKKLEFTRVLDTGMGEGLQTGSQTYTRGNAAVLDISEVGIHDKTGVFKCGYEGDETDSGIIFVIPNGYFPRPIVANVGETTEVDSEFPDSLSRRWLHDGEPFPEGKGYGQIVFTKVIKEDAGVYERYLDGQRRGNQLFRRLIVRGCPANIFGENCDKECPPCYNGGICHDLLGTCICPPGFDGNNCEVACGENRIGKNCSESCEGGSCLTQVFCLPDPYGCSCATGIEGNYCTAVCYEGNFGPNCEQTCHCVSGSCDPYTGACSRGCSQGWSGPSCQIPGHSV